MSAQDEKPVTHDTVKQRRRCKLCPRKRDRKATLTCLKCKGMFCKDHLFFLCAECIYKKNEIPISNNEMHVNYAKDFKHRLENIYKENYCIFCKPSKCRKTSRCCDSCGIIICKNHNYRQCQKCKPFVVFLMQHT